MTKSFLRNFKICIVLIIFIVGTIAGGIYCAIKILSKETVTPQAYQEAMEKGIYEFDRSFEMVVWQKWATAHFMICEPPKTPEELKDVVRNYVKDNDVVNEVRNRIATEFPGEKDEYVITLTFYEPSSKFPIGWQARPDYDFTGNDISDNIIFTILLESGNNDTYTYTCGRDNYAQTPVIDSQENIINSSIS